VEVLGRYLNRSEQGERIREVLQIVPSGPSQAVPRTPKRVFRRLEPAKVVELIRAYSEGVPVNDLAAQFNLHRSTVLEHLNRAAPKRRNPAMDQAQVEEAARLYRGGKSLRDVGIHFGVHASTVSRNLTGTGVTMRDCHGRDRNRSPRPGLHAGD
jgi:DNA invertase Pin-like site-specific DNA recombinase